jgi:uncharacterized protein
VTSRQAERREAQRSAFRAGAARVGAGPFRDQEDPSLRGLCFYACGVEEARRLAEQDPAVRAGRLAVEAMTWLTQKNTIRFLLEKRQRVE